MSWLGWKDFIVALAGAAVGLVASGIFLVSVMPALLASPRPGHRRSRWEWLGTTAFLIIAILQVVASWNPPYPAFGWGAGAGLSVGALVLIVWKTRTRGAALGKA